MPRSPFTTRPTSDDPLAQQLRTLGLYVMAECYQDLAEDARKARSPYPQYLAALVTAQLAARMDRSFRERLTRARFPTLKTLEAFDFAFQPTVDETLVRTLGTLTFLAQHENVLLVGPPGVGKTHLAIALGVQACAARKRVLFFSLPELLDTLVQAQAAGELARRLTELARLDLLILDELGYLALDQNRANLLFMVVSRLYEKGSIILTTNRRFETWASLFGGDGVIAGAILDRLLHHRHLLAINGPSYRTPDLTGGTPASVGQDPAPMEAEVAQFS
ncbi:MAG: IS21-like element helper ATPase IstB [Actinomycetota bacterium]